MPGVRLAPDKGNKFTKLSDEEKRAYMREAKRRYRARKKGVLPPLEKKPRDYGKEYYEKYRKHSYTQNTFGISADEYDKLIEGKVCGICGSEDKIVLDHCHNSGNIRGPLCTYCNSGLGFFRDDPERLRAAATYLEVASLFT